MSEFRFTCPRCDRHIACDERFVGRQIQCPGCNHLLRIPSLPEKRTGNDQKSGRHGNVFGSWPDLLPPKEMA
jgi:DNA-directed RNA polymerase subunit RPC12/RpoP